MSVSGIVQFTRHPEKSKMHVARVVYIYIRFEQCGHVIIPLLYMSFTSSQKCYHNVIVA